MQIQIAHPVALAATRLRTLTRSEPTRCVKARRHATHDRQQRPSQPHTASSEGVEAIVHEDPGARRSQQPKRLRRRPDTRRVSIPNLSKLFILLPPLSCTGPPGRQGPDGCPKGHPLGQVSDADIGSHQPPPSPSHPEDTGSLGPHLIHRCEL